MRSLQRQDIGFTLIELSIVLVIIGLIIGGVLVGQDLIKSAETRATISQIEKYNTAANTFKVKYGYLPGDIPDPYASQFGFKARGAQLGQGDGNGVLEGSHNAIPGDYGFEEAAGETVVFWADLSTANLIDGNFITASATPNFGTITFLSSPSIPAYLPLAKLGQGNYIYVWSGGYGPNVTGIANGINYFGLSAVASLIQAGGMTSNTNLTNAQAYNIDKKTDDGLPQSGNVTATYLNFDGSSTKQWAGALAGTAASASATTCYDNGGNASATMQYSMTQGNGSGPNCALSFKMQGAAR